MGRRIGACIDPVAYNYNRAATVDDGSCVAAVTGCTQPRARTFDAQANVPNHSACIPPALDSFS
eukprot:SAG25_NODE_6966_length_515_cov_0.673077_1_plen_63_part_10